MISLINFTELNDEQKDMVLSWRNHEEIRKWMYDTVKITKENHYSFIDSLKERDDRVYFLVKDDSNNIGVVDFTSINYQKKECEFGLYANPFEKIAGVGRVLEKICIDYVFENLKLLTLKCEVFSDNSRAIHLYRKFNFQQTELKIVNNKEVICMELKYENR